MRRKVVETLALVLVLAGASIGMGQPATPQATDSNAAAPAQPKPAPAKSKLEEMLAEALRNNPDIRVAEAKLAEADAELNRTRLLVTQKVIDLHHAILSQKAVVEYEQKKFERMKKLAEQGSIDSQLLDEAQQKLTIAKAKLAELEAQVPALLGKVAHAAEGNHIEVLPSGPRYYPLVGVAQLIRTAKGNMLVQIDANLQRAAGPMAERIRKALQTPVKADYKDESFDAILKDLAKKVEGLSFRNLFERGGGNFPSQKMSLRFEEALPVSALLQALADETGCTFVVRDYGILAIAAKNAPPGAMTVQEFLQQKPAGK